MKSAKEWFQLLAHGPRPVCSPLLPPPSPTLSLPSVTKTHLLPCPASATMPRWPQVHKPRPSMVLLMKAVAVLMLVVSVAGEGHASSLPASLEVGRWPAAVP